MLTLALVIRVPCMLYQSPLLPPNPFPQTMEKWVWSWSSLTVSCGAPLPRVGAVDWSGGEVTEEEQKTLEAAMYRLREQVAQRRVLAKPCFQDFDMCVCVYVHVCL